MFRASSVEERAGPRPSLLKAATKAAQAKAAEAAELASRHRRFRRPFDRVEA
jgi:hypothetical protein